MRRERRAGQGPWVAAAVLLALAGCGGGVMTATDEFTPATSVVGPNNAINPLAGDKVIYFIQSEVDKTAPHAVRHRLVVDFYPRSGLAAAFEPIETIKFDRASDEDAAPLPIEGITKERCPFYYPDCLKKLVLAVGLEDAALRRHVLAGYRVKIAAKTGESEILALPPEQIRQQLAAVDRLVAGAPEAPKPGTPQLGIGVLDATAAPLAGAPQGVIVVAVSENAPAAAAGIAPGDVLMAINGEPVRVAGDVGRLLGAGAGAGFTFDMRRGDSPYSARLDASLRPVSASPVVLPAAAESDAAVAPAGAPAANPARKVVALVDRGGTYVVPVVINGTITLNFVLDSGASDVAIPADVASTLMRAGTIAKGDFLDKQTYVLADGHTVPSQRFRIRSLKIGDLELRDVTASISPARGSLLLGQSFLRRFNSWSIDNARHALVID